MFVTPERQPISPIEIDGIDEGLDKLAALKQIAFVLNPIADDPDYHIRRLTERVNARAIRPFDKQGLLFDNPATSWHVDNRPIQMYEQGGLELDEHKTTVGKVLAELTVPKPALWRLETPRNSLELTPRSFRDDLNAGRFDDELVVPVIYEAELSLGAIVVFALGGPAPTLHRFTSLEMPRESYARLAVIPLATA